MTPAFYLYEDELPTRLPEDQYDAWFRASEVVGGVRIFPVYLPSVGMAARSIIGPDLPVIQDAKPLVQK